MKKAAKAPSEKTVRALLEKHGCPVPFHVSVIKVFETESGVI